MDLEPEIYDADEDEYDTPDEEELKMNEPKKVKKTEIDAALTDFVMNRHGLTYGMVFDEGRKDTYTFHPRIDQPCYGELRPYGKTHPDLLPIEQRSVGKPGDLHYPFPKGTPVKVAVPVNWHAYSSVDVPEWNEWFNLFFNPALSPWKRGLTNGTFVFDENNRIRGLIQEDGEFEPTVFVNALIAFRNAGLHNLKSYQVLKVLFGNGTAEERRKLLLISMICPMGMGTKAAFNARFPEYFLSGSLNIRNFVTQTTVDRTGGLWKDRYAYDRPGMNKIFDVVNENHNAAVENLFYGKNKYEAQRHGRPYDEVAPILHDYINKQIQKGELHG